MYSTVYVACHCARLGLQLPPSGCHWLPLWCLLGFPSLPSLWAMRHLLRTTRVLHLFVHICGPHSFPFAALARALLPSILVLSAVAPESHSLFSSCFSSLCQCHTFRSACFSVHLPWRRSLVARRVGESCMGCLSLCQSAVHSVYATSS